MNLKQIIAADKKDFKAMDGAINNYAHHAINIGERLTQVKNSGKVEDFQEWVETTHPFTARQGYNYLRAAKHKVQLLHLLNTQEVDTFSAGVKLLPKLNDAPLETEADPANLGYVGKTPGTGRNSDDWHTPKEYTDAACRVMGGVDLDPFSSEQANGHIAAVHIFTEADNALEQEWGSPTTRTVWMNPPYSSGMATKAVDKFIEQYDKGAFDQAVVLMNSSTDTLWFHRLAGAANAVCFTKGRISFQDAGGKKSSGNTKGQVFFYFGDNVDKFHRIFSQYGFVMNTGTI